MHRKQCGKLANAAGHPLGILMPCARRGWASQKHGGEEGGMEGDSISEEREGMYIARQIEHWGEGAG